MDAIRIENLRSLVDTGYVEIKPITLLVGQNNSGKSSFLRAIPLFRQSIEAKTTGPILWYGQYVDFGSFSEAVSRQAKAREMAFHFRFRLEARHLFLPTRYAYRMMHRRVPVREPMINLMVKICGDPKRQGAHTSECHLEVGGHQVSIAFSPERDITEFLVNEHDLSNSARNLRDTQASGLIPHIVPNETSPSRYDPFHHLLITELANYAHRNTSERNLSALGWQIGIGTSEQMLQEMRGVGENLATWTRRTSGWTTNNQEFQKVRDLVIAANTVPILSACDDQIASFAANSRYIAPVRATAERYYRLQNLAVDEVDFQGTNLAVFLRSLTDTEMKRFRVWADKLLGFSPFARASGGHISLIVRESGSDVEFNLADKGFGFSQLLPILTQLWVLSNMPKQAASRYGYRWSPPTLAIEQPELHLHPQLQARMADLFIVAIREGKENGVDLKLVVETHSETIINRLGHRVAVGAIDPNDVNVVIFEKAGPDAPTTVRIGEYDRDGFLTNWPLGFFDPTEVG